MSLGVIVLGRVLTLGQDVTATKGLEFEDFFIKLIPRFKSERLLNSLVYYYTDNYMGSTQFYNAIQL